MKIEFAKTPPARAGALAIFVFEDGKPSPSALKLLGKAGDVLVRALKASRFEGKPGELVEVLSPAGAPFSRVLAAGLGTSGELSRERAENAGAKIAAKLQRSGERQVTLLTDGLSGKNIRAAEFAAHAAAGLEIRGYHFSKYKTKQPEKQKATLEKGIIVTAEARARKLFERLDRVIEGIYLTRDLVTEPANVIFPASFAREISKLRKDGVAVEILRQKDLKKLGFNALLAVGQGSANESHVVVMKWNGGGKDKKPVAFVGKGVTFDTGGISLKPPEGMEEMKWDMGGAAIVVGAMKALARRKARVNAVGVVGLVENMPSGTAQRPGDVVKSLSGQTIEVLNTDAEGRLVLADCLWYAQARFKPQVMIDLATLTGAIIITLGRGQYAGFFTDNDEIAKKLAKAGKESGDKVWRLPLSDEYDKMIDCDIADMKNIGGREAGSITAAQFLKRFTNNVPWAHIDVAGMVWTLKPGRLWDKGATGYGVRLLDQFVAGNYEA